MLYVCYVGAVWLAERAPPVLGEAEELVAAREQQTRGVATRVGRDLAFLLAGVVAMAAGATLLVEAVRRITSVESTQTELSLSLVGFVTAFELVVLAWSAARRGATEAVVAAVVGSVAYNATMTLGTAAIVRPLEIVDAAALRGPAVAMLLAWTLVAVVGTVRGRLREAEALVFLALYAGFLAYVLLR